MTKKQAADRLASILRDIAADCVLAGYGDKTAVWRIRDYYNCVTGGLVISDDAVEAMLADDDGEEGIDLAALTQQQE